MKFKLRKILTIILPVFSIIMLYVAAWIYSYVKIFVGPCTARTLLGIYCPGCGATHSVYALLEGHILRSFAYNPIIPIVVIFSIAWYIELVFSVFGKKKIIIPRSNTFLCITLGILMLFYIARNFFDALSP